MRPARMLLGAALAMALAWPAHGQAPPYPATVQADGAEVRCKPGTEPAVYVTHKLPRGTAVEVVEKLPNGWLKIDPPRGAFSWINTRALRPADGVPGVWVVAADAPVPILVGSPYKPGKPDAVGTNLARGAQVIAVGQPRPADDGAGSWLPILPPPGEYRYIREADVSPAGGPTTATTVAHPGSAAAPPPAAAGSPLPPLTTPADTLRPQPAPDVHVPAPAAAVDPLLQQAEQLERAGDKAGAARLYDQLGNKSFATNHDAAVQYYNRAAWLRGTAPAAAPAPATQADALFLQARQYEQAGNWPEASKAWARLGDLYRDNDYKLSMQYYNRAGWARQHPAGPRDTPTAPPAGAAAPAPVGGTSATTAGAAPSSPAAPPRAISVQTLPPGVLLRSAYPIDGRPTYALETPQAQVIAYLTPEAGVDLEGYVGKNVEVFGHIVPRPDLRDKYMTVTRARLLTAQ